eukprot:1441737-Rhodomonas_salina.1
MGTWRHVKQKKLDLPYGCFLTASTGWYLVACEAERVRDLSYDLEHLLPIPVSETALCRAKHEQRAAETALCRAKHEQRAVGRMKSAPSDCCGIGCRVSGVSYLCQGLGWFRV